MAETSSFKQFFLTARLQNALAETSFSTPTPIQEKAIPAALEGKDVLGIAPTGSGKTAAFVLPALHALLELKAKVEHRQIPALILVPTRELAEQMLKEVRKITDQMKEPVRSMAVYGGVSANVQMMRLGGVQLLIATPGRLLDLERQNALQLSSLQLLVLDEADKMLNLGFKEEMEEIMELLPIKRQNLLFSATLSPELQEMQQLLLNDPIVVEVQAPKVDLDLIQQRAFRVRAERKGPFLRYLIKSMDLQQVLVFVSSIKSADQLVKKLEKNGIEAKAAHGNKSNHARQQALGAFKKGKLRVLVATDLLSRGIDISELPCVINYELPRSPKDFIHRIGRTGRADNSGQAFSIVMPEEQPHFKVIQKKIGKWLTLEGTDELDLLGC